MLKIQMSSTHRLFEIVKLLCVAFLLMSCAAEPDSKNGFCKIQCNNASPAGDNFLIQPVLEDNYTFLCASSGESDFVDVSVQFKISKPYVSTGQNGQVYKGEVDDTGFEQGYIAAGGVAFVPNVMGIVDKSIAPKRPDGSKAENAGYLGINTPLSEFCSDTCGIATVSVKATCRAELDNKVIVGLSSGAAKGASVELNISGVPAN